MSTKVTRILLLIIFIGTACICWQTFACKVEPCSFRTSRKRSANLYQPEIASNFKRFKENAPTLTYKLLQVIYKLLHAGLWILGTCLNALLWLLNAILWPLNAIPWLLNATISFCTEVCVRIFGILFNIVKLLEAFGFGVKFLLELNYAVLSYIFDTVGCIKAGIADAVVLVKITLANQTEHVYESSSMAFEGVQNLFLTACNQTWVNARYISSIVANNFTLPFGLSALDSDLLVSMFLAGLEFFMESIKMTSEMFKDGNLFLLSYTYGTLCKLGENVLKCVITLVCGIKDVVTVVKAQIVSMITWPFYSLSSIVSNISFMLCYSWESLVIWLGYIDSGIRETVFSIARTIVLVLSGFVSNISGCLWIVFHSIARFFSGIVYIISGTISSLTGSVTGFINSYIPGGYVGCTALVCVSIALYFSHDEITSLIVSSWVSLRRMNENARPIPNIEDELSNDEQDFEVQENEDIPAQNMPEPLLDGEMPQNPTKLQYELELEKDKRLCVICQDKVKNVLLMPCRHVCMCQHCLLEIRLGHLYLAQCPLCRTHIQSTLEVFV